jgi:hypothetical protein
LLQTQALTLDQGCCIQHMHAGLQTKLHALTLL